MSIYGSSYFEDKWFKAKRYCSLRSVVNIMLPKVQDLVMHTSTMKEMRNYLEELYSRKIILFKFWISFRKCHTVRRVTKPCLNIIQTLTRSTRSRKCYFPSCNVWGRYRIMGPIRSIDISRKFAIREHSCMPTSDTSFCSSLYQRHQFLQSILLKESQNPSRTRDGLGNWTKGAKLFNNRVA